MVYGYIQQLPVLQIEQNGVQVAKKVTGLSGKTMLILITRPQMKRICYKSIVSLTAN